ncbi:copper chaperone CopZ [Halalkalibacter nanhaiisediminis]|uniref:Copper chaperone CopZ n=1 Tax=Halalkalibacter nanhaiisediminis TaxID=688079 RepID=A0A562QR10_9BACI|nr:copper chaperone CopZ [Halalkalibacter nanhaiisediminis]TWI59192.1 copper chaperone [Halalkalibacter nanhaiisediminis]
METTTLNVKGMTCGHCVAAVEGNVGKLDGVNAVKVDLGKGTVDVTFDQGVVSLAAIREEIEEQGYDVE